MQSNASNCAIGLHRPFSLKPLSAILFAKTVPGPFKCDFTDNVGANHNCPHRNDETWSLWPMTDSRSAVFVAESKIAQILLLRRLDRPKNIWIFVGYCRIFVGRGCCRDRGLRSRSRTPAAAATEYPTSPKHNWDTLSTLVESTTFKAIAQFTQSRHALKHTSAIN